MTYSGYFLRRSWREFSFDRILSPFHSPREAAAQRDKMRVLIIPFRGCPSPCMSHCNVLADAMHGLVMSHIVRFFLITLLFGMAAITPQLALAQPTSPEHKTSSIGIAVFNAAWAGTMDDFKRHVEVCSTPEVNWCSARSRRKRRGSGDVEEEVQATLCQKHFIAAAGGPEAATMIAPCTAYGARKHPGAVITEENYD